MRAVSAGRRVHACDSCCAVVALMACVALCASGAAPALAAGAQFATEGEGAGQLGRAPSGIAVNQQSGDVYLADGEETNNRADEFSATGEFLRSWGWGVSDGESEEFQVCEAPGPCFSGLSGSGGGQFSLPHGAAVDNSAGLSHGNVYIGDPNNQRVEEFGPEGGFLLAFGGEVNAATKADVCLAGESCQAGTPGPGPSQFEAIGRNAIVVGFTGTVYVGDINRVQKFSSAGVPQGEIELPGAGAVEKLAVDSSGELYVLSSERQGIRKYNGEGVEQGPVRDEGLEGFEPSIAVGPNDELIVSDPFKGRVLEYDPTGKQTGSFPLLGSGASGGIALNDSTRALYVIHHEPSRVTVQTLPPPGPFILEGSESASEVLPTSATLNATINPEGPEETSYHFEYGTTEAYGQETAQTPLEGGEEGEFRDQPAIAQITGLTPSTLYHFRAVATNALGQTTFGPDQTFESLPPVSIESESVTAVTARSAKLLAELNPHGLPTEYHFEYGTTTAYGQSTPEAEAGHSSKAEVFSAQIEGLQPHTAYHYRVVARNELGVVQGPDQTFTTQSEEAPSSIDGRGYEMVSPADKHGGSLEGLPVQGVVEAASDGSALAYITLGSIEGEPAGARPLSQVLARRTGVGSWSAQDISTPHRAPAGSVPGDGTEYKLFSEDLSRGVVEPAGGTPLSPLATEYTPYVREADGSYTPLVYPGDVPAGTPFGGTENDEKPESFEGTVTFVTGTPDLGHLLFHSPTSLVQGFETRGRSSDYEWSDGKLTAVSILPNGASASEDGGAEVGNRDEQVRGAVSTDGNRVFFAVAEQHLYMRDIARAETLRVDAAAPGVNASEGGAKFQWANNQGSKVLFTDDQKLTKDSTAASAEPDLYECEVVIDAPGKLACKLRDLSVDPHPGEAADVLGTVIGADEAGRYVYFVAKGALEQGAAQGACPPVPGGGNASEGQCVNLYVYDTVTQSRSLVAVLSAADFPDWKAGEGAQDLGLLTARVSPDGHYLAFMSQRPLTGYDNRDALSNQRDEEIFLFHAADPGSEAGALTCPSCDPTGQRPVGVLDPSEPGPLVDRPETWAGRWLAASIPGWVRVDITHALRQPRYLSNSGRLFFNSAQALAPADGNGTQDVYEFEPSGVGGCHEGSGCVSLISSGSSSEETALLDASESGDDLFFITAAQLSSADEDGAFDIYDAHVCTLAPGCATSGGGKAPPCISTDACRAAPAAQPDIFGAPPRGLSSVQGNLAPPAGKASIKRRLTRARKLAKALKACRAKHDRHKRVACERAARKRYGAHHHKKRRSK